MAENGDIRQEILPKPGEKNILITSALPYVNNVPHLGNIIGSVLSADVFARYCRARGVNTLYVCGTDEYGTTTETRALVENSTPKQLCDKYHAIHADIYKWFRIKFDIFGRTTTSNQTEITQEIFLKLKDNEYLQERMTTQLYCQEHKSFLADRFVEGECPLCGYTDARGDQCDQCGNLLDSLDLKKAKCKVDGSTPSTKDTKHMFLELDKLQDQVNEFYCMSSRSGSWTGNGISITSDWLKKGLQPRSITRDFQWGTKVPLIGYEDKVIYPWFDACIGYISITATYTNQWRQWWQDPENVRLYQFIGKDNVVYHSVIFPGTLLGTKQTWTMLHHLSTSDYLTYEGGKFSKSRGNGVFGDSAQKTGIAADVWRYYLLAHRPEAGDTEFNWDSFVSANNNILLKNLGNLVSRIVKFVNSKHFNGTIPEYHSHQFNTFMDDINALLAGYIRELDSVKLRAGISTVLSMSQKCNGFLQSQGLSNQLAETEPQKCASIIGVAINLLHLLSALVGPYMPDTADAIDRQLNATRSRIPDEWKADSIKPGHTIGKAEYLFQQIPVGNARLWRDMFGNDEWRTGC